jgi:CBS domain-containing protein
MAAYLRGVPLREIVIESAMSRAVQTCKPTDTVEEIERRMSAAQVRRIPIVGGVGQVVGIVSLSDIVRARARSMPSRLFERIVSDIARTFAAITEPRPRVFSDTSTP